MGSDAALLVPNSMFPKVINNFLMQKKVKKSLLL